MSVGGERSQSGLPNGSELEEIDALVALGARGVPQLIARLTEPHWAIRREIVAALSSLGDAAVRPLARCLKTQRDDETRIAAAVDALVASRGQVNAAVFELAEDENPAVVADAAQILGRRRDRTGIPILVRLTKHPDDNVAVAAIEALGRIGGRSVVDALVAAVSSNQFFRTFPAIDVLGRCGDPRAVEPLARLLPNSFYTVQAARALGRTVDRAAALPLAGLLTSAQDANVRVAALALADLHHRHRERYGTSAPIEEALRRASSEAAIRRLTHCVLGADPDEQAAICVVLGSFGDSSAAATLTRLLDAHSKVAAIAAEQLKRLGRDSDAQLLSALHDGDSARRLVLLPLIVRASATEEIINCLSDVDGAVRALACDALARIGNPLALPALFELLADRNARVVQAAIGAIQSLGSNEALTLAMDAARSPSPAVRRGALRILSYFGHTPALDIFIATVADPDPRVRDAAIQGLPFLDCAEGTSVLLRLARDPAERTRAAVMRAFRHCSDHAAAAACLLSGLSDPDAWVRYYACQSLGKLGVGSAAARVAQLIGDEAGQVRVAAVEALANMRSDGAYAALYDAARSTELDVQRAALVGLGLAKKAEGLPTLLEAAAAPDAATRLVALTAIAEFPSHQVLPVLARAATDEDEGVRTAALGLLATRPGLDATRVLVGFLEDVRSRDAVIHSLLCPSDERVTGLLAALDTASEEVAPYITSILARLNRADATAALFEALQSQNPAARKAVVTTLGALGSPEAFAALTRCSRSDADAEVRHISALLLAR